MPAIRLADIPNAGPQALGPSGNLLSPSAPQLTGAAALDPNALAGAAKQMQLDTYNLNAFSGEAAGLANMGDAFGDVATVGFRFSRQMQEAKDNTDYQQAKTVLESAWQKQLRDQETVPFAKWGENFQKNLATAKTALSEIKFSNRIAGKINQEFEAFAETRGIMIDGLAKKRQIDDFQKITEIAYKRELAKGNLEGAFSVINTAEKDGTYGKSDADAARLNVEVEHIRNAKEERNANVASKTIGDPIAAERDLGEAVLNGKPSKLFPELTDKADQVRAYDAARAEAARYRQRLDDDALDMILTGDISTEKDLRNFVGDALPEQQILPLLKALSETPVQREKALALRPMVYAMADTYNPENDDENRSEYFKIRDTIFQLPSDQREEPLAMLRKARDEKVEQTPLNIAKGQLKDLFDAGKFGSWLVGDDKKPLNDDEWDKYIDAGKKYAGHKSALEIWAKNNPREASSPDKVYEQFNRNLTYERKMQKYQKEKEERGAIGRFFFGDPVPPAPPVNPDDALQKIKSKSSLGPKATKKQIEDEVRRIDFETPLPEMPS